jgi:integrase/recombinase XerD
MSNPIESENRRQLQSTPAPNMLPPAVTGLLNEYSVHLDALGRSDKTIESYLEILTRFFSFLNSEGKLGPVAGLGRRELSGYLLHLQQCRRWPKRPPGLRDTGGLSPFTIQDHARTIKVFWSWLTREGYIDKNPLEKFPLPSVPKTVVKTIKPELFQKLLGFIDRSTAKGIQRYCMMLTIYDAGPRISEVLGALIENVDFNVGYLRVLGKGRRERDVPLSRVTVRELKRYVREFRPQICPVESPYLFPRPDGQQVTKNCVQQYMRRLAKKAGLDSLRLYPHLLRHSFGTEFIKNGGSVFHLKEIMGHSSLSTTLKYTHLQSEDLRREHARFSPIGNIKIGKKSDDSESAGK